MSETDTARTLERLRSGDRAALARALTLVESTRADHRTAAMALLSQLSPPSTNTLRIGISGAPGVGKSTFIEALGRHLIDQGRRIAVLAVDPSSRLSGGSILGDKTRMEQLARSHSAFVRPSPAGDTLGGVARRTREATLLVEAAGYDVIVIETVGVGQSETAVADLSDLFLLLLAPAGGDELQGIKRGVVEVADLVAVNKADGALEAEARRVASDHGNALRMMRARSPGWSVPVALCSALDGVGVAEIWQQMEAFRRHQVGSGDFARRRAGQGGVWLWSEVEAELVAALRASPSLLGQAREVERAIAEGQVSPPAAAASLVKRFLESVAARAADDDPKRNDDSGE